MPIHTRIEAQEIRYVASQATILRYNWCECIEHIKSKTGHDLSKTAFFKIKKQLKSEGRDWVFRLRDDHDEFIYEYRQRYEELFAYQKELWDIVIANKQSNPMVCIRAIESLHSLTNDIAQIVDLAPSVAGGDSVKSSTFLSTQYQDVSEIPV
ncbi:MAG: hypothetical protein ACRD8W_23010 [Nitrososphaeraceae archaeon]